MENKVAYDALRGQLVLLQAAMDALFTMHPEREKLATIFEGESEQFLKVLAQKLHPDAYEAACKMRLAMIARLRRTEH
jgi:hypothetical protein